MTRLLCVLLTLLFSLSGPAMGEFSDFCRSSLAAKTIPELEISASKYPELAENILNAQKAGHPDILTHGGDIAANRAAALEGVPNIKPFSRDEYPFASSMEGGGGSWVGHVPVSQQNAQGALMKNFFKQYNIQPANEWGQISTSNKMLDLLPPVGIGLGMARPLRINVPGAWHHVTARGNERRRIFRADRDYARLMEILEEMGKKAGGVDYAAVGMALRRFESKMRKGGQLGREAGLLEDQLFPVET